MSSGELALACVISWQRARTSTDANGGRAGAQLARMPDSRNGIIQIIRRIVAEPRGSIVSRLGCSSEDVRARPAAYGRACGCTAERIRWKALSEGARGRSTALPGLTALVRLPLKMACELRIIVRPASGTSQAIDLRTVDRHPLASVGTLVLGPRCSWCPGSAPMPKLLGLHALPPMARQADLG
jgi:hypothetical protein